MYKKDKELLAELESQTRDLKVQLTEQLKCLDQRVEVQIGILAELQDYFKKRAELEADYSRALEKLHRGAVNRHKSERHKREAWPAYALFHCWQNLLNATSRRSWDHGVLGEIYANQTAGRFAVVGEDLMAVYKKCREIGVACHADLMKVLNELHSSMKTYQTYHADSKLTEAQLRKVENQKRKIEEAQHPPPHQQQPQQPQQQPKPSKKLKAVDKALAKRQHKHNESSTRTSKARNEYLLCLDAVNAAVQKYFVDDLSDLVDCMDFCYHNALQRAFLQHLSCEEALRKSRDKCNDGMQQCVSNLDPRTDKQAFIESHSSSFNLPRKFEFIPHRGDVVSNLKVDNKSIAVDLRPRHAQLRDRLEALRLENDELWKTMAAAEKTLMDLICVKDYEVGNAFEEGGKTPSPNGDKPPPPPGKAKAAKDETLSFYVDKFRDYLLEGNLQSRLQAKHDALASALFEGDDDTPSSEGGGRGIVRSGSFPYKTKKRIGRAPNIGQPKLFGGRLDEYLESTGQEMPLVVTSCVRVINLYGLHHQGIFRVSGSQIEINEFKSAFEKGEDPLQDIRGGRDINSVAGVLKLYFRELKEPLFPSSMFNEFTSAVRKENIENTVDRLAELVAQLPQSIFVVMRYMFAFLKHLSEYSDENMMDTYNLAICFGPTLLPIPADRDQVEHQSSVIDVIKVILQHHEAIFPSDLPGTLYEKVYRETDGAETGDEIEEEELEEMESDLGEEPLDAVAQFDFRGRNERELTFQKGDELTVYSKVDDDWWYGSFNGLDGLIPDRYVLLRTPPGARGGAGDADSGGGSVDGLSCGSGGQTHGGQIPAGLKTPDSVKKKLGSQHQSQHQHSQHPHHPGFKRSVSDDASLNPQRHNKMDSVVNRINKSQYHHQQQQQQSLHHQQSHQQFDNVFRQQSVSSPNSPMHASTIVAANVAPTNSIDALPNAGMSVSFSVATSSSAYTVVSPTSGSPTTPPSSTSGSTLVTPVSTSGSMAAPVATPGSALPAPVATSGSAMGAPSSGYPMAPPTADSGSIQEAPTSGSIRDTPTSGSMRDTPTRSAVSSLSTSSSDDALSSIPPPMPVLEKRSKNVNAVGSNSNRGSRGSNSSGGGVSVRSSLEAPIARSSGKPSSSASSNEDQPLQQKQPELPQKQPLPRDELLEQPLQQPKPMQSSLQQQQTPSMPLQHPQASSQQTLQQPEQQQQQEQQQQKSRPISGEDSFKDIDLALQEVMSGIEALSHVQPKEETVQPVIPLRSPSPVKDYSLPPRSPSPPSPLLHPQTAAPIPRSSPQPIVAPAPPSDQQPRRQGNAFPRNTPDLVIDLPIHGGGGRTPPPLQQQTASANQHPPHPPQPPMKPQQQQQGPLLERPPLGMEHPLQRAAREQRALLSGGVAVGGSPPLSGAETFAKADNTIKKGGGGGGARPASSSSNNSSEHDYASPPLSPMTAVPTPGAPPIQSRAVTTPGAELISPPVDEAPLPGVKKSASAFGAVGFARDPPIIPSALRSNAASASGGGRVASAPPTQTFKIQQHRLQNLSSPTHLQQHQTNLQQHPHLQQQQHQPQPSHQTQHQPQQQLQHSGPQHQSPTSNVHRRQDQGISPVHRTKVGNVGIGPGGVGIGPGGVGNPLRPSVALAGKSPELLRKFASMKNRGDDEGKETARF